MTNVEDGILLLDKPLGLSSNVALQKAKRILRAKKCGHTGSLDPLATGMLPLCFGEATKYTRFLLEEKKCYQTTLRLGVTTSTGDGEGEIIATKPLPTLTDALLAKMLQQFQGEQQQIPPMYSAIKHQGQPLYKLARQGKEIERKARTITISRLILDNVEQNEGSAYLTLTIECTTGTYIRTLAEDMGTFLGCGAHVSALRRLWVWPFQTQAMVTLETLDVQSLIPLEAVLPQLLPAVSLNEQQAHFLSRGLQVQTASIQDTGWVALMTAQGTLLGVGEMVGQGRVAPRRLCATT